MKLEVRGLEFSYDARPALDDVSLTVDAGEIVGLVGPNGSGKSTLLRCLNRILVPDAGSVLVEGDAAVDLGREDIARTFGYVPQERRGGFPTTVFDTVLMGRKPHMGWQPSDEDVAIVSRILEQLELDDLAMRDLDALSGGQRQKVVMARALAQEPEVLLLDEPTSNLDLRHQLQVLDIAKAQTRRGVSAILVIHDLNLAARYCDKIVLLSEGEVYAAGGPEVLCADTIEPVYGVTVTVQQGPGGQVIVPDAVVHTEASSEEAVDASAAAAPAEDGNQRADPTTGEGSTDDPSEGSSSSGTDSGRALWSSSR